MMEKPKTEIERIWSNKELREQTQQLNEVLQEQEELDDERESAILDELTRVNGS